jgi:hypothetical protein
MYMVLFKLHTRHHHMLDMGNAVRELMCSLCQRGSQLDKEFDWGAWVADQQENPPRQNWVHS